MTDDFTDDQVTTIAEAVNGEIVEHTAREQDRVGPIAVLSGQPVVDDERQHEHGRRQGLVITVGGGCVRPTMS